MLLMVVVATDHLLTPVFAQIVLRFVCFGLKCVHAGRYSRMWNHNVLQFNVQIKDWSYIHGLIHIKPLHTVFESTEAVGQRLCVFMYPPLRFQGAGTKFWFVHFSSCFCFTTEPIRFLILRRLQCLLMEISVLCRSQWWWWKTKQEAEPF